jgi:hypothetical protein
MTCEHVGRIEKDLPCPDPDCPDAGPRIGTEMHVPEIHKNIETQERELGVSVYRRQRIIDVRLHGGGYWRWDGPEYRPLKR